MDFLQGVIMLPTHKQHTFKGKITANYHGFALFDTPNMGNVVTLVLRKDWQKFQKVESTLASPLAEKNVTKV